MQIGGLQRSTFIDYPGKIAAIVFTVGCNFRCPYCHNPELVEGYAEQIPEKEVFDFLSSRIGKLDAVTITGGEPTMQHDLIPFIEKVKNMGFLVKLDTNGTRPEVTRELADKKLIDYVAMDIKAPIERYESVTRRDLNTDRIWESVSLLKNGRVPYEFRTTVVKSLLSPEDFHRIGEDIRGAKTYYLQKFIPSKVLLPDFMDEESYSDEEFEDLQKIMKEYVDACYIR